MFSFKIFYNSDKINEIEKTIKNIISFIKTGKTTEYKTISDNESIEISFGKEEENNGYLTAELIVKKVIVINKEDLNDKSKLDKHLFVLKEFCKKAKEIEDIKYLPLPLRNITK